MKPLLRTHPLLSVTETNVYVVVEVTGFVGTLKGVPLVTPFAVWLPEPSLYTISKGPAPAVAVHVNCPVPLVQKGPLAVSEP